VEKLKTDTMSKAAKKIPEPIKAIPQASRQKIVKAAQQLKKPFEPKPRPWRKRFEILAAAIAITAFARKAIGPKNTEK
jgi:hypothetical protein